MAMSSSLARGAVGRRVRGKWGRKREEKAEKEL